MKIFLIPHLLPVALNTKKINQMSVYKMDSR